MSEHEKDPPRRNPWGAAPSSSSENRIRHGPWGTGGGNSGGGGYDPLRPPDMEDFLRGLMSEGKVPVRLIMIGAVVLFVLWVLSGLYMVSPGEHAVIQRFGAWQRTQEMPGLSYRLPWPIETATLVKVEEIRNLNIGFLEGRDGKKNVPEESLILTADSNIVDVYMSVQWRVRSARDFLFNVADPEDTLKKVAESGLREVAGQTQMSPLMEQRDAAAARIATIVQKNLDSYNAGILIVGVPIDKIEVHPDAQAAFQDVQSAKQDAENAINLAGAYRNDIIPKARGQATQMKEAAQGYGAASITRAQGGTERFNALYSAYVQGKEVTRTRLYTEMMEAVLGNAQTIVLDDSAIRGGGGAVPYISLDKK